MAAVGVYALISAGIILIAAGNEQELVLVYAVAVFVSFLRDCSRPQLETR